MVWDEDQVRTSFERHYSILRIRPFIVMADVIRLFALAEYGGLYLDLDVGCGGSVEKFLHDHEKIYMVNIWAEDDGLLRYPVYYEQGNNWMLACRPGHQLMRQIADGAFENAQGSAPRTLDGVASIAGSRFIGGFSRKHPEQFSLINHKYINEVESIQNVNQPDCPVLVHIGEHTWNGQVFSSSRSGDARDFHPL